MRKAKSAHEKGFLSNFDLFTKNSPVSSNFDHISPKRGTLNKKQINFSVSYGF
jgi:hypothetical protein